MRPPDPQCARPLNWVPPCRGTQFPTVLASRSRPPGSMPCPFGARLQCLMAPRLPAGTSASPGGVAPMPPTTTRRRLVTASGLAHLWHNRISMIPAIEALSFSTVTEISEVKAGKELTFTLPDGPTRERYLEVLDAILVAHHIDYEELEPDRRLRRGRRGRLRVALRRLRQHGWSGLGRRDAGHGRPGVQRRRDAGRRAAPRPERREAPVRDRDRSRPAPAEGPPGPAHGADQG